MLLLYKLEREEMDELPFLSLFCLFVMFLFYFKNIFNIFLNKKYFFSSASFVISRVMKYSIYLLNILLKKFINYIFTLKRKTLIRVSLENRINVKK